MEYDVIKLTSKGQMTLPASIRKRLKLKAGDRLVVYLRNNEIHLKKLEPFDPLGDEDPIWELVGLGSSGQPDIAQDHDRHLAEEEVKGWQKS